MADGSLISVGGLRIGLVEDEPELLVLLRYNLEVRGFDVEAITRGDAAVAALRDSKCDLLLLDWTLPGLSGIELLRRLRRSPETRTLPIIVLTARTSESDLVRAFDTGADDFICKPFSVRELLARTDALLRRRMPLKVAAVLTYGDIEIDRIEPSVRAHGKPIDMSPTDRRLLECFMSNPSKVLSRQEIIDAVWGRDVCVDERTIDVNVSRLRRVLQDADAPIPITTIRSVGYRLDQHEDRRDLWAMRDSPDRNSDSPVRPRNGEHGT